MQRHPLSQNVHQILSQRLIMTHTMQKALKVLELPILELSEWLMEEVQSNPLLNYQENYPYKEIPFQLPDTPSFFSSVSQQVKERIGSKKDFLIAEEIIWNLDERGYLDISLKEIAYNHHVTLDKTEQILKIVQECEPLGIGARDLQECLLIQLRMLHKESTLAYQLVNDAWEDLKKGRFSVLEKKFKTKRSDIQKVIQKELATLTFHPKKLHTVSYENHIADLILQPTDEGWEINTSEKSLPQVQLNSEYKEHFDHMKEYEKEYIRGHASTGQLIIRAVHRRRKTLQKIGEILLKYQMPFLSYGGYIKPMSIQDLAVHLNVHESTAFRAVSKKWIWCPRGWLPIKSFFCKTPAKHSHQLIHSLKELIQNEDKHAPLTDDQLSSKLQQSEIKCSRRTIAKYRKQLYIRPANQRKI